MSSLYTTKSGDRQVDSRCQNRLAVTCSLAKKPVEIRCVEMHMLSSRMQTCHLLRFVIESSAAVAVGAGAAGDFAAGDSFACLGSGGGGAGAGGSAGTGAGTGAGGAAGGAGGAAVAAAA